MKKRIIVGLTLVSLCITPAFAHTRHYNSSPTQPDDHYVPASYVQTHYTQSHHVNGYMRKDGKYVEGYDVQGGQTEGHEVPAHWNHKPKKQ